MNAKQKVIKILKKHPELDYGFGGNYTTLSYFVRDGKLYEYYDCYDYHGKSMNVDRETIVTESKAKELLPVLEKRLLIILQQNQAKSLLENFYE